ncbi:pyridoxal phosphate-dependent aminotransferase [Desulfosoma caldarium]|uniref:Aminotransferase n=1 Tax=Desulfosoma caldarium TaxID=610254 RepID=A0A3N1UQD5_9BACT|nr:pyridoxal phosphate-dependent aminotransferase [Desulfosoma caldarium]ROQ92293.1 aminotransferase [Desulfosoma caldarium]
MALERSALEAAGKRYRDEGISRRVRGIAVSAIKEIPLLAQKVPGCVSLGQGISSFPTPEHIVDAVCRHLRESVWTGKYTLGPGLPALRRAFADMLVRERGLWVDPDTEICITVGAMEGLCATVLTLIEPGDEVLLPSPNYASHIEQVLLAEGIPVFFPLKPATWQLDLDALGHAISPRTKAIIICHPHNPTGAVFSKEDLLVVAQWALEHGFYIICDETYDFLTYDGKPYWSLLSMPELRRQVIGVFSFSKKYAMTGWRVGAVVAPADILDHVMKVHDAAAICAPTPSQVAALAALEGPQECVAHFRKTFQARRDRVCSFLDRMAPHLSYVKPQGAYYVMVKFPPQAGDSMTVALRLLHEARVITIPGSAFGPGGEGHVRLSFGSTEAELDEAMERLARWFEKNTA